MRQFLKTSKEEIIEYWSSRIDETELSIDFSEAGERCWRCGYKTVLHRCHIIPSSQMGEDSPDNLVLLCNRCHREAPNISDKDFFWDWLKAQKTALYDTYWTIRGMKEYEEIYKESVEHSLMSLNIGMQEFKKSLSENIRLTTIHFGEGRLNPSTIAGLFRKLIKEKETEKKGTL